MRRTSARPVGAAVLAVAAFAATVPPGSVQRPSRRQRAPRARPPRPPPTRARRRQPSARRAAGRSPSATATSRPGIYPIVAEPARIQAESHGYEFLEGSANGDCDQQVRDVENFVAQEVDAIVVLPLCGVDPLTPVLEDATAAGITVVGYSTEVPERRRAPSSTRTSHGAQAARRRGDPLVQRGLHRRQGELRLGAVHLRPVRHRVHRPHRPDP